MGQEAEYLTSSKQNWEIESLLFAMSLAEFAEIFL